MLTAKELYEALVETGEPMDHHESDLYVIVSPATTPLVKQYEFFTTNVRTFVSNIDGKRWYDVPFGYIPFWEKRHASRS